MGHRPSKACLDVIMGQVYLGMKYCSADDVSNAAFAFSRMTRWGMGG